MTPETFIIAKASEAIQALYGVEVPEAQLQVQVTRKEFEGDYTLVVFPLLKMSRTTPENTGNAIGEWLKANVAEVAAYNTVKGFLNISFSEVYWNNVFAEIAAADDFGQLEPTGKTIMVEYSSPNTNKPLHLGHIRNNLLGWSVAKLLEVCGHNVMKVNLVNDRGIHICKSMYAWKVLGNGETPQSSGKKGDHLVGDYYVAFNNLYKKEVDELVAGGMSKEEAEKNAPSLKAAQEMLFKWENGDAEVVELWKTMNGWVYEGFDKTYSDLGISFDRTYYESQTYLFGKALVQKGLEAGIFEKQEDGSVWCDLTADGLDRKLLLRGDGTSVYMTQDLGTAEQRFAEYSLDEHIYVVGNEQNYHFQVLSILLDRLGFKWGKELVHFSYGMVELPNGKMKSREGTVVDADDLMEMMVADAKRTSEEAGKFDDMTEEERSEIARIVGMGALKYFILKVDARKNMLFNPEESIDFNGNTGPFIQYTHARIRSILRKAETELGVRNVELGVESAEPNEKEVELIQKMNGYADVVAQAGKDYSPSGIANYCYELTKEFNQFYHDYSILREEDEQKRMFRLVLAKNVAKILKNGMSLLGIEVPERM